MATTPTPQERTDLLDTLAKHRALLRYTTRNLTDDQARLTPTVSELCLGGLIKHVSLTEARWVEFIDHGASAFAGGDWSEHAAGFRMTDSETLAGLLQRYADVAARTDDLVRTAPDLDAAHPLPSAPWFPPDTRWSVRRVLMHIVAETAQHAGHADILREAIDGAKSMG